MGVVDLVTNTVCIERAVCFIGVWEHSVKCWFYPQKGIKKKKILLQHIFGMTHTHKSQRTSVTHSLSHTNMTGTWLWLPDGFSTLEHGTRWFRMMYTDHSIFSYLSSCVFALLIFFFSFKCTCMALGRSGALLISINILFKNKRSTVYNTFHNHTWFLHKNVAKQVSSLSWPSSPLSPNLPPPSLVPTASPRGSAARP